MNLNDTFRWQLYVLHRTKVDPATGCWVWQQSLRNGYGQSGTAKYHGLDSCAHRTSYMVFVGPIPANRELRHQCHNPPCCNPEHLLLGTHQENLNDNKRDGIRHTNAVLTVAQVAEIKRLLLLKHTHRQLGAMFGVSHPAIGYIARGKSWADVQPATN
jgi:hypothetical protein